jgi:ATP-dependent Clp protease ATP-binding subunit ClpA
MFERLTAAARDVVGRAEQEARAAGSRSIEAEHLLLALADGDSPVADVLADAGVGRDALVAALAREEAEALAAVGVSADAYGAPEPVRVAGRVRMGTSAKRALERSVRAAAAGNGRKLEAGHLLLGVTGATEGTVVRALRLCHADVSALRTRARSTLT